MTATLTLTEQNELAYDGDFIAKLKMAMLAMAGSIMVEDSEEAHTGAPVYVARMLFANQVLGDPQGMAERGALLAAVSATHADHDDMTDAAYIELVVGLVLPLAGFNGNYTEASVTE